MSDNDFDSDLDPINTGPGGFPTELDAADGFRPVPHAQANYYQPGTDWAKIPGDAGLTGWPQPEG